MVHCELWNYPLFAAMRVGTSVGSTDDKPAFHPELNGLDERREERAPGECQSASTFDSTNKKRDLGPDDRMLHTYMCVYVSVILFKILYLIGLCKIF